MEEETQAKAKEAAEKFTQKKTEDEEFAKKAKQNKEEATEAKHENKAAPASLKSLEVAVKRTESRPVVAVAVNSTA